MGKSNTDLPPEERCLVWRWPVVWDGKQRLLVPRANPEEYEFPMDLMFDSEEKAVEALAQYGCEEEAQEQGWVLCEQIERPIKFAPGADDDFIDENL